MKGFMKDQKFHPMTQYKKVRKSRDPEAKTQGVVIRKQRTITKTTDADRHDMVIFILQNTDDGNDLSNGHLRLVQGGANNALSENGNEALKDLFEQVKGGNYQKPFFHGIQNMTQDQEGFIYWKGIQVEHYSFNDWENEDFSARELAEVIKDLEKINVKVSSGNVLEHFDTFRENHPEWKRNNYIVSAFDKDGKRVGAEWVHAIDMEGAEKEFARQNKAGSFREEYQFDKLDAVSDAEAGRRQNAEWERRTGRKLRRKRDEDKRLKEMFEEAGLNKPFREQFLIEQAQKNPKNVGRSGHEQLVRKYWNDKVHPMGSSSGTMIARKDLDPDGYKKAMREL